MNRRLFLGLACALLRELLQGKIWYPNAFPLRESAKGGRKAKNPGSEDQAFW